MSKQGFSRNCRLTERPEFVRLFDNPKVHRARAFQAFWKTNQKNTARLGITIKGRLSSVWRMRVKRIVREWFRTTKERLGNNDINVVFKVPQKLDMSYLDEFKKQLNEWKR